jgi:molybdopterin molybdotransferase
LIDFDEACRRTAALAHPLGTEALALADAAGRVLAAPVVARRTSPQSDTSAMDGYAVRSLDLRPGGVRLRVVREVFAGDAPGGRALHPGECARIYTGAPVPGFADQVVMQEAVRREGDVAVVAGAGAVSRHVRRAGSDFSAGETVAPAGMVLTPQALVGVAAADVAGVEVFVRPRVTILSTGDELAEPGEAGRRAGAIPDSVSFGVAAMAEAWGAEVVGRRRVGDNLARLADAARAALDEADVVVVTGGASVGERDYAKAMFAGLGLEPAFEKVAIKPGKPVWLGRAAGRLVVGLPGNPSAAMVTARLFLAPLLAGLAGRAPGAALDWRLAPLAAELPAPQDRECFHRARTTPGGALPLDSQDSSAQKALATADLLIRRRRGARALDAGDLAEVLAF